MAVDEPTGKSPPRARALTGIKPSGTPHIGNFLGMIRPALELSLEAEAFYFIADYHALTTVRDPQLLQHQTLDVAATWLAFGLDPERTVLFRQSDVPEVCELAWMLSCVIGLGFLNRAHAFKDAQARGREINAGTFYYPILMAADILAYDSTLVPVGKDQKQHVEMARDMAMAMNHHYGDVLVVPQPVIRAEVSTIVGTDGQKMSKSYGNVLPLFERPKRMRKAIMRIVTDSTPLEAPKDPDRCSVFALYRHFASPEQVRELAARYRAGGLGYGHAKQELFEQIEATLAEPRRKYQQLMADPQHIQRILDAGRDRAKPVAKATLERVREAVGIKRDLTVRSF